MSGADDILRHAFRQGPGREFVAPLGPADRPLTSTFGSLPNGVATDRLCRLVWGTIDLFEDTTYPHRCAADSLSTQERVQHALVMAFGLQRREPSNLFNDHRSCASVRSRFPVHVFVHSDEHAWLLDVYRHGLLPVGGAGPTLPAGDELRIALSGRFTHLPSLYGRLRGPLVELELGMSLRALWVALELLGLNGELRLPAADAGRLMGRLALEPRHEWSVPLTVALTPDDREPATAPPLPARLADDSDDEDPTLGEVVAVNRTSLDVATVGGPAASRGGAGAVPEGVAPASATRSWAEVVWHRNSGRMPRHLAGFSGRRRAVPQSVLADAVAWLALPPPTPVLRDVARHVKASVCVQDTAGLATGWYRVKDADGPETGRETGPETGPATGTARLELVLADPSLPSRLEACYGHGLGPNVGCAVRHASMVWLLSVDVASLIHAVGPGAWTLAQYACGWMAHGLCLAAAAHGLYARPSRAFDEILLHPVVGMAPGEMVLLSVVSGTGRFVEPALDLRT